MAKLFEIGGSSSNFRLHPLCKKYKTWFGLAVILLYSFMKFKYTDLNLFLVRKAEVVVFLAVSERNKNTLIIVS